MGKAIDMEVVGWVGRGEDYVVTVEENVGAGGAGSAVAEALAERGIVVPILHLGLTDKFVGHGDPALLLSQCGLDAKGIAASIVARFGARLVEAPVASIAPLKVAAKPAAQA